MGQYIRIIITNICYINIYILGAVIYQFDRNGIEIMGVKPPHPPLLQIVPQFTNIYNLLYHIFTLLSRY